MKTENAVSAPDRKSLRKAVRTRKCPRCGKRLKSTGHGLLMALVCETCVSEIWDLCGPKINDGAKRKSSCSFREKNLNV